MIFVAFTAIPIYAGHIVGGEIYYDCLGDDNYGVTIKVYRECGAQAPYDSPLILGIFNNTNNSLVRTENVSFPGSEVLPVEFNNPCVQPPGNICIEEAIYRRIINLPPTPDGYTLSYQRCCRAPNIVNLANAEEEGLTLTTTVPGTNSGVTCNSSPRFTNFPPLVLCNNQELVFDHSGEDPDGDEIVYELCTPYHGGSFTNPLPNPPTAPSYQEIVWENGFSETEPFGANGPINLNPTSGMLNASPLMLGQYVVGIMAREFRNGVLLSETRRDFVFTVFNCNITLQAGIVAQEELSTFVSFCQGLTINFENSSFGGSNYFWDFGVDDDPNATSTSFQPSFTFPEPGSYDVTLIVNPNWPCSDTLTKTFIVNESLDVWFDVPPSQCVTGNSFDFEAQGNYEDNPSFFWDFGQNASPNSSEISNPTNIVYNSAGLFPITLTVEEGDCIGSFTDSLLVYQEPTIAFDIEEGLYCAPFIALFENLSAADTPLNYLWDFGDGTTSSQQNPVHVYEEPGIYNVSLAVTSTQGCTAELFLEKPGLIEVFPSPTAAFTVDPEETTAFQTEITFEDESIDSEQHFYFFTETDSTEERTATWNYHEGGSHRPFQVVINEYGCRDTAFRTVFVAPQTTLYIPNAFTPDGDDINPVFKPVVYDVDDYEFIVYNRWGKEVYRTGKTSEGWDGTHNGKESPVGVYVWLVRFRNDQQIFEQHLGHVSLIR